MYSEKVKIVKKFYLFLSVLIFTYGCATSQNLISQGEIYNGMTKKSLRNVLLDVYPNEDPFIPGSFSEYNRTKKSEIISGSSKKLFYVFKNVNKSLDCGLLLCKYGDGKLTSWHYSLSQARASLVKTQTISKQTQPKINNISDKDPIESLNKLIQDFENGKISEEEFNTKKQEILK